MSEPGKQRRLRNTLIVLAVIGILVAILYPAIRAARQAARRSQQRNNLKQVGIALQNFHDIYKALPPAVRRDELGRPLASWRFQILPFIEAMMIDVDFADRWDDPANRWLTARYHHCYCFYRDRNSPNAGETNLVAVTGPGTAFEEGRPCRLDEIDSDTILVVEVTDSDTYWTEPGDLHVDRVPESLTAGPDGEGFHVLFADGTVWFLHADIPLADVKKFFTIEGAAQYDRDEVLRAHAP